MTDPAIAELFASHPPMGDALPASLRRYYAAIDAGRFTDAAAMFSKHTLYAVPLLAGDETQPRALTRGTRALRARFENRGLKPWRHHVQVCVADRGGDAFVEGVLVDGGRAIATFVASASIGEAGTIDRYLAYSCDGAREPIPAGMDECTTSADALAVLESYFAALDDGRFGDAANCFAADILYSHPPYRHTGIDNPDRVEFRGRSALLAAFEQRGRTSFDHEIISCIQRGPHCVIEGVVHGLPDDRTGSFVSSLSLARDGTIQRYLSFFCEPGVPLR